MHYYGVPGVPKSVREEIQIQERKQYIIKRQRRKQTTAVCLYKFCYLSVVEIHHLLKCPYTTVYDWIHRYRNVIVNKEVARVKNKFFG